MTYRHFICIFSWSTSVLLCFASDEAIGISIAVTLNVMFYFLLYCKYFLLSKVLTIYLLSIIWQMFGLILRQMSICVAKECGSYNRNSTTSVHRLPTNSYKKSEWIRATSSDIQKLSNRLRICGLHSPRTTFYQLLVFNSQPISGSASFTTLPVITCYNSLL